MNLNDRACRIIEGIRSKPGVRVLEYGDATVVDVGVDAMLDDGIAAEVGCRVAEACMGGLGSVKVSGGRVDVSIPEKPAVAALSCHMAGWAIEVGGERKLGSGPARIPARKPKNIIDKIGYHEKADKVALILESDVIPDREVCREIIENAGAKELVVAVFKGDSDVGVLNVLARVVETAVFRLYYLGYDTGKIISGEGGVPVPKPSDNIMYTTNDVITYGSRVELTMRGWDESLTEKVVSKSSSLYGKSFKEILDDAGGDFYRIDPGIFAPAEIKINDVESGRTHTGGRVNKEIISRICG